MIAGTLKGRRLTAPDWPGLRPTSDKLRETLFNIVASRVPGARVLDAFAGTGALGIEALSRGARHVTFVERDRRAATLIAENLARCRVEEGYAIIRAGVRDAAKRLRADAPFDLILLDPPYASLDTPAIVSLLAVLLEERGLMILEHAARQAPAEAAAVRLVRTVRSGDSALSLYVRSDGTEGPPAGA